MLLSSALARLRVEDERVRDSIAQIVDEVLAGAPTARRVFKVILDPERGWNAGRAGTSADAIARSMHTTSKTLECRYADAGAPSLKELVDATFLVRTIALLNLPGSSVYQVSSFFKCASATSFIRPIRRMTGQAPSEWSASATYPETLAAFRRFLQLSADKLAAAERGVSARAAA